MMRGFDKELNVDRLTILAELVADHLADLDLAVVDWDADIDRTEGVGAQPEVAPGSPW